MKVAFTDELLGRMERMAESLDINSSFDEEDIDNTASANQRTRYPIKTLQFDEYLVFHIMEKPIPNPTAKHVPNTSTSHTTAPPFESLDKSMIDFINRKQLSKDKALVIKVMYNHFKDVLDGTAKHKTLPFLLVTGTPGTGKSWLI